jgi:hypothetical protein
MSTGNSNAETFLTKVPVDVFLRILEYVSEKLLEDVKNVQASDSITQYLNQYAQLHLVCRSFHELLTHYVLVDGVLFREKLAEAQIGRFKSLLTWHAVRNRKCTIRFNRSIGPPEILRSCGYVWKNPLFPRFLRCVFVYHEILSEEALGGFTYLWKKYNETFV